MQEFLQKDRYYKTYFDFTTRQDYFSHLKQANQVGVAKPEISEGGKLAGHPQASLEFQKDLLSDSIVPIPFLELLSDMQSYRGSELNLQIHSFDFVVAELRVNMSFLHCSQKSDGPPSPFFQYPNRHGAQVRPPCRFRGSYPFGHTTEIESIKMLLKSSRSASIKDQSQSLVPRERLDAQDYI